MKKMLKQILAWGLVLALSLHFGIVLAEENASKLSEEFLAHLETMSDTDTAQIAVFATGEIPSLSQEEYEAKVIEIMGEENYRLALTGSPKYTEQVNQLIEIDRQLQKEAEETFHKEFLEAVGLEQTEDMVIAGVSVTFRTTKAEILRLAKQERVDFILWLEDQIFLPEDVTNTDVTGTDIGNDVIEIYTGTSYIYKYTAVSALHILRAAVGKEMGSIDRRYDVNADGEVNAVDALWALQSAVGKRVVEWPLDKGFLE